MRYIGIVMIFAFAVTPGLGQEKKAGPTNEKAQKSYHQGMDYLSKHLSGAALESFKKADKQDGGRCQACQRQIIKLGVSLADWKAAETAAVEMVDEAEAAKPQALAHYEFGSVLMGEGLEKHKDEFFTRAHEEFTKALAVAPNFPMAVYSDGVARAYLNQDDAAKGQFRRYASMASPDDSMRRRALFFVGRPEMARAKMAPLFDVTTVDGQHISLQDLKGKVVLIDFWATWCGPCREALPHMQHIAQKFQGQPLVIISVSLDPDEKKWKDFISKNRMTWLNCRDGSFDGPMATLFNVHAIPHTFTIDLDGVLQDEHVGDAAIEGKLKKQLARARELQGTEKAAE